jgi:hypothetical protein
MNLENIWNECRATGERVRRTREQGQAAWQPLKERYSAPEFKGIVIQLNPTFVTLVSSLQYTSQANEMADAVFQINGVAVDNTVETQHFLAQHFRLPLLCQFQLPVVKLAQLAYNVGQFKAAREHENAYDQRLTAFYDANQLGELAQYI